MKDERPRCSFPKCRNLGRSEADLNEEGIVTLPFPVCQKHFIQAIEAAVQRSLRQIEDDFLVEQGSQLS